MLQLATVRGEEEAGKRATDEGRTDGRYFNGCKTHPSLPYSPGNSPEWTKNILTSTDILRSFPPEKCHFKKNRLSNEWDAQFEPGSHLRLTWVWKRKEGGRVVKTGVRGDEKCECDVHYSFWSRWGSIQLNFDRHFH